MKLKKTIFTLLIILPITTAMFFWKPLLLTTIKWKLNSYCETHLQAEIRYEKLDIEKGALVAKNVYLEKRENGNSVYSISVKEASLGCSISLAQRKIHLELSLSKPTFFTSEAFAGLPPFDLSTKKFAMFSITSEAQIKDGSLEILDKKGVLKRVEPINLFLKGLANKKGQLLLLTFSPFLNTSENSIEIKSYKQPEEMAVDIIFNKVELSELVHSFHILSISTLKQIEAKNGVLSGKISFNFDEKDISFLEGELFLDKLDINFPDFDLSGHVKSAKIELEKKENPIPCECENPSIVDRLKHSTNIKMEILKESSLALRKDDKPRINIKNFLGTLSFHEQDPLKFNLKGEVFSVDYQSAASLSGSFDQKGPLKNLIIDAHVGTINHKESSENVHADISWNNNKTNINAKLFNASSIALSIVKEAFSKKFNILNDFHPTKADADLGIKIEIESGKINYLKLDKLDIKETEFSFAKNWYSIDSMQASGTIELENGIWDALDNLDLKLNASNVNSISQVNSETLLKDFHIDTNINSGFIDNINAKGSTLGIAASLSLDSSIKIQSSGNTNKLSSLFKENVAKEFEKAFENTKFNLTIKAANNDVIKAQGTLAIHENKKNNVLPFSFTAKSKGDELENIRFLSTLVKTISKIRPFSFRKIANNFDLAGSFSAENLPLERFLGPFITDEDYELSLIGYGNCTGSFRDGIVTVKYDLYDASLESKDFKISPQKQDGEKSEITGAYHKFNLIKNSQNGFIPLKNVSYLEKTSGYTFENVDSSALFEDELIRFSNLTTDSPNISLAGNIDINFIDKNHTNLDMHFDHMRCDTEKMRTFLSKFDNSHIWKFPLKGEIATSKDDFYMRIFFLPNETIVDTSIKGIVSNTSLTLNQPKITFENIKANFEYDSQRSKLEISNIEGSSKGQLNSSKYEITPANFIKLDFKEKKSKFDLLINNKSFEPIKVVGQMKYENDDFKNLYFSFDNKLTHFGDLYPNISEITITNYSNLSSLKASPQINLAKVPIYIENLEQLGISLGNNKFIPIFKTNSNGILNIKCEFNDQEQIMKLDLEGSKLTINSKPISLLSIKSQKSYNHWILEDAQIDKLSISADFTTWDDRWAINFLKMNYENDSLTSRLHGEFFPEKNTFDVTLDKLSAKLDKIKNTPIQKYFANIISSLKPKGILDAKGKANIVLNKETFYPQINASLELSMQEAVFRDIPIKVNEKIKCQITDSKELLLGNANVTFNIGEKEENAICKKLNYSLDTNEWAINDCDFSISSEGLLKLTTLSQNFINKQTKADIEKILPIITSGNKFSGNLSHLSHSNGLKLSVKLSDEEYSFFGTKCNLSDFEVNYKDQSINSSFHYNVRENKYWCELNSKKITEKTEGLALAGKVYLYEKKPVENEEISQLPLAINWKWHESRGFKIKNITGSFSGIESSLIKIKPLTKSSKIGLKGDLKLDFTKVKNILPEKYFQKIEKFELGSGICFDGTFFFDKLSPEKIGFKGMLTGSNFNLLRHTWESMRADLSVNSEKVEIKNIIIEDPSGNLKCKHLALSKQEDGWFIDLPFLQIKNFRPSVIKDLAKKSRKINPLTINQFQLKNLKGPLNNKKMISGNGWLNFENKRKKNVENTIFALPHEIISTIGLNPSLLIPVAGKVSYEIKDETITLLELTNAHSKGKRSKFYLSQSPEKQFIDFNGDMNIKIKIKQNNLIFKLAELMTISIEGNVLSPKCKVISGRKVKK